MLIVSGQKMYGRVDEVPRLFHVQTRFGHLWYLPLIPMGSYLMIYDKGKPAGGIPLGFHFKSFAMAWLRTAMLIATVSFALGAIVWASDTRSKQSDVWWIFAALAVICASAGLYFSYAGRFRRATYYTALKLSHKAKFNDEANVLIELHFGNITAEEARELIDVARSSPLDQEQRESAAAPVAEPK